MPTHCINNFLTTLLTNTFPTIHFEEASFNTIGQETCITLAPLSPSTVPYAEHTLNKGLLHGGMEGWRNRQTDGLMGGWMDVCIDGWLDGRMENKARQDVITPL